MEFNGLWNLKNILEAPTFQKAAPYLLCTWKKNVRCIFITLPWVKKKREVWTSEKCILCKSVNLSSIMDANCESDHYKSSNISTYGAWLDTALIYAYNILVMFRINLQFYVCKETFQPYTEVCFSKNVVSILGKPRTIISQRHDAILFMQRNLPAIHRST